MKRLKRLRNNPGKEVPEHLLLTAFRWETMREQYFLNLNWFDAATEARSLREIYSKRLWNELAISITLQCNLKPSATPSMTSIVCSVGQTTKTTRAPI